MIGTLLTNFLVPFLIGFLLLNGTTEKYKYQHYNNEILFLHSLLWGFGFVFSVYICWPYFDGWIPISETSAWETIKKFIAAEAAHSAETRNGTFAFFDYLLGKEASGFLLPDHLLAAILLTVITLLLQVIYATIRPSAQEGYLIKAIYKVGDRLERLLYKAKETKTPIMVTLKNRKVYIGFVQGLQEYSPRNKKRYLILLPIQSGSRENESLRYTPVEDYRFFTSFLMEFYEAYQDLKSIAAPKSIRIEKGKHKARVPFPSIELIAEYPMLIDMDEIVTANPWIQEIFDMFGDNRKSKGKNKPKPKSTPKK